jgi:hypothetical protein
MNIFGKKSALFDILYKTFFLGLSVLAALSTTAKGQEEQQPTAAEMAAKLANSSVAVAQMSSNFDFTFYEGDLPDAGKQDSFVYTLQPTIPFPMENGKSFFCRPAIPVHIKQPVYDVGSAWDDKTALGEISFDIAYGGTNNSETT